MDEYSLDIVMVSYKSKDYLASCLASVHQYLSGIDAKIFVEDNSCGDDLTGIQKKFPNISLTCSTKNLGFARAANNGIKRGRGRYVLLVNPDSLILEGFFEKVLAYMEQNPEVGVLGPKIVNVDGSLQGSARSFPSLLTALFGRSSLLSRLFPKNKITRKNVLSMISDGSTPMSVDWVSGACMLIRRRSLEEVGLFDEQFFMYWEDADLCRRMKEKGWNVVYFPSAKVLHYSGVSSSQAVFRSLLEFHKSSYRLFCKYWHNKAFVARPLAILALASRLAFVLPPTLIKCKVNGSIQKSGTTRDKNHRLTTPDPNRIRVLTVISRLNIGGPAIHVALLTSGLKSRGFQNYLVTGQPSPKEGDMSYLLKSCNNEIFLLPTLHREINFFSDFRTIISLYRLMRQTRPHIVDTHTAKAGFTARIAASWQRVFSGNGPQLVHTFHGNVFRGYFRKTRSKFYVWVERVLARGTDVIIAISPAQKEELVNTYKIASEEKVRMVPLGLELDKFLRCKSLKGLFRKGLSIGREAFLVGIVGRLVPIKNHVMFLNAAKSFLQKCPSTEVKFVVVGDGELRDELESLTNKLDLKDKVSFCGWIKEVQEIYADLDVLVLTSMNEGTPVSIIEAMASKVPVISTCVGGVQDLIGLPKERIRIGEFAVCERGILCNNEDSQGLAKALEYVLREEKGEKEKRLKRAQDFVKEKYSKDRLLNDMEALYIDLVKAKSPEKFSLCTEPGSSIYTQ